MAAVLAVLASAATVAAEAAGIAAFFESAEIAATIADVGITAEGLYHGAKVAGTLYSVGAAAKQAVDALKPDYKSTATQKAQQISAIAAGAGKVDKVFDTQIGQTANRLQRGPFNEISDHPVWHYNSNNQRHERVQQAHQAFADYQVY